MIGWAATVWCLWALPWAGPTGLCSTGEAATGPPAHVGRSLSGMWTTPAGETVVFRHDAASGTLHVRWWFNSNATGPIVLRGSGVIDATNLHALSLLVSIEPVPLFINGRLCETSDIRFSSTGWEHDGALMMRTCRISFRSRCGKEEARTRENVCDGMWQ